MPTMMLVLDPGLLGLMSNILMKESFAARLGHQVSPLFHSLLRIHTHVSSGQPVVKL